MKRQNASPNDGLSASMCRTMFRSFVAPELEPCLLHCETRGRAADQYELIRVAGEVLAKDVKSPHHGKCPLSSSSAS